MFKKPKQVPYITKNGSKEPKMVLKMVLETHLEPFREPLKVPPVGQPNNLFFFSSKSVGYNLYIICEIQVNDQVDSK